MYIKELNFKHETLKLLEESVDYMVESTGIGQNSLNKISFTQELRSTMKTGTF